MTLRQDCAAVFLAGGLGSRMAADGVAVEKPLRPLAGRPLLAHAIARIVPQVGGAVINANGDPTRYADFGLEVIADTIQGHPGPLAGILSGMRWAAAHGYADLLSIPADTPFLPDDLLPRLQAARAQAGTPLACAASGGWRHHVVGLWPVRLADALETALQGGLRKVGLWTGEHGIATAEFTVGDHDPFFNINTAEDLADAERIAHRIGRDPSG